MAERYSPLSPPSSVQSLAVYLFDELTKLSAVVNGLADGNLEVHHNEPSKPRDGRVVVADGTDWNPGSGQGVYCYYNSTWNKL